MKALVGSGNRKGKRIPIKNLFAGSGTFLYNEGMKNKEPIVGSIHGDVSTRSGRHQYDAFKDVVEITFHGTNCNYVQVLDMVAARELSNQLKKILPSSNQE
jgi:hypothetical protein